MTSWVSSGQVMKNVSGVVGDRMYENVNRNAPI